MIAVHEIVEVARVSDMREDERGGDAVIVLHGWGAPGDDLVPVAEALRRPGVRFFVPAGPLPEMGGGRAWWHLTPGARPPHASTAQVPPGFRPTPEVVASRVAVQALIAQVVARYAPTSPPSSAFSKARCSRSMSRSREARASIASRRYEAPRGPQILW